MNKSESNINQNSINKARVYLNPKNYTLPLRQKIMEYVILFIVSTTHLLLFSLWTSPFYKYWYGCDASFFTLVGRGIIEGKVPYKDFFDLKGPYFFFIEAIGQFFAKARLGAFIVQIPFAFASLVLVYEICLLFINKKKTCFVMIVYLWGYITTLWGGNTSEEFALPFSLLCLYIILKYVYKNNLKFNQLPLSVPLLLGIVFGFDVFSKISLAAPVLGILASVVFYDLFTKHFKDFAVFIIYVILGIAISILPLLLYFGSHNALQDMIHCMFSLGFSRSLDYYEAFNITWELKLSGCIFAFIFACLHFKVIQRELSIILMAMSAATYLLLHLGTPYYYYFTTVYPCMILALALFIMVYNPLIIFENIKQAICVICLLIYAFYYVPSGLSTVRTVLYDQKNDASDYHNACNEMAALIPENERTSVMSFMIDMQWFEATQIMPCNKYVVNLPFFIELDPPILDDLSNMFINNPPKWLVIGPDFDANLPAVAEMVDSQYECIFENQSGRLFIHN